MYRACKSLFLFAVFVLIVYASSAEAQLSNNVLLRLLLIETPSGRGTAFTMDVDGRQYLITAKHMVPGWTGRHTISFREMGDWSSIEVTVYPCADPVDIAVLIPPRILTATGPLPLESQGNHTVIISQDVYFAGYPYGASNEDQSPLFASRPMPTIKRGILATSFSSKGVIEVDALNNPGFSGSPIVFRDNYEHSASPVFYVLGVVKGYHPELIPVLKPEPVKRDDDLSKVEDWRILDGGKTVLRDTPQRVPMNSGILIGYPIDPALDIIKQHPEGPTVTRQ